MNIIIDKLKDLNQFELAEVWNIMKKSTKESYMKNNNGIFLKASSVDYKTWKEVAEFLSYCEIQKRRLLKLEETKKDIQNDLILPLEKCGHRLSNEQPFWIDLPPETYAEFLTYKKIYKNKIKPFIFKKLNFPHDVPNLVELKEDSESI